MDEQKAVWYLPDEAGQPVGPYASNKILEQLSKGRMPESTLCWREGMPDWQPLAAVEPFAAEIKLTRSAARKRMFRIVIAISFVVCVIAAAAVVYIIMMGPPEVRRAKEFIAAGLYTETSEVLGPYVNRNPLNNEAVYLLAVANVNEYATAKSDRAGLLGSFMATKPPLEQAKELFARVFKADPEWIEKAKIDIADAALRIPSDAQDALNRNLEISRLQAKLNLADKKYLAGELLKKLISQGALQDRYNLHQEAALEILGWDPSLGQQIITQMLGDENVTPQQLSMTVTILQRWARERPAFAQILLIGLLNRAKSLSDAGRNDLAKILFSNALSIDPQVTNTEAHLFLYIRVMDPSDEKLTRCQFFLRDYPDSSHRLDVLKIIVRDATAISRQFGRWNRNRAQLYLSAGLSSAKELISQDPKKSKIDLEVFELAKQLAESNQYDEATDLTSDLLAAVPETAIKLQIEQARTQWRSSSERLKVIPGISTPTESITRPRALIQTPNIGTSQNVRITNSADLAKVLTDGAGQRIIWVAVSRNDIDIETRKVLRNWINKGGVLWVETDLAESFGFTGLRKPDSLSGRAEVLRVQGSIVFGMSGGILNYELDPNGSIIKSSRSIISRSMIPLLVQPGTQNDIMTVISAARDYGDGLVIFRPATIDSSSGAGRSFESILDSLSSNPSQYKLQTPVPDRRRRTTRPPGRRR